MELSRNCNISGSLDGRRVNHRYSMPLKVDFKPSVLAPRGLKECPNNRHPQDEGASPTDNRRPDMTGQKQHCHDW